MAGISTNEAIVKVFSTLKYKTHLEDDVADTKVPLESVNLLPELLAHVGHVGPLAGLGEEQQEAELGGSQQPGEAHTIALVHTLVTNGGHRALATRNIEGAGQPVQLVTLQGEVGLGGQEGPPRLLCCCLLYTSPSPRDGLLSRMPSSA